MADERSPLESEIRRLIVAAGPTPVGDYMRLCLTHPQHGYYLTSDPIGTSGDFITAPEISQMFGELIGCGWRPSGSRWAHPRMCASSNSAPGAGR
jgi:SAM-dependent MidA family methyltransferase